MCIHQSSHHSKLIPWSAVKKAYYQAALKYHPDRLRSDGPDTEGEAVARSRAVFHQCQKAADEISSKRKGAVATSVNELSYSYDGPPQSSVAFAFYMDRKPRQEVIRVYETLEPSGLDRCWEMAGFLLNRKKPWNSVQPEFLPAGTLAGPQRRRRRG